MTAWHHLISMLPFEWAQFAFMQHALLAVLLIAPIFALLGCVVISNRMTFFSDAIGHSTLTGIALGSLAGWSDPCWAIVWFAILLALGVEALRRYSRIPPDTILGLVMSVAVALGLVLLSRGGGFARYAHFLVGDILTIAPGEIARLGLLCLGVLAVWLTGFNPLFLTGMNRSLARSRGQHVALVETGFAVLVALVVAVTIPWIGLLVVNSLLILPAATARNLARNMRQYSLYAVAASLLSAVAGLLLSYRWNTASGATMVLVAAVLFLISLGMRKR